MNADIVSVRKCGLAWVSLYFLKQLLHLIPFYHNLTSYIPITYKPNRTNRYAQTFPIVICGRNNWYPFHWTFGFSSYLLLSCLLISPHTITARISLIICHTHKYIRLLLKNKMYMNVRSGLSGFINILCIVINMLWLTAWYIEIVLCSLRMWAKHTKRLPAIWWPR